MLQFLADENFDGLFLRVLLRRYPELDVIRVQDTELVSADDPAILEWAAKENRVVLTHDVTTMTRYAFERVRAGLDMPGVCEVNPFAPVNRVVEDIFIVAQCSFEDEWADLILYIPLP